MFLTTQESILVVGVSTQNQIFTSSNDLGWSAKAGNKNPKYNSFVDSDRFTSSFVSFFENQDFFEADRGCFLSIVGEASCLTWLLLCNDLLLVGCVNVPLRGVFFQTSTVVSVSFPTLRFFLDFTKLNEGLFCRSLLLGPRRIFLDWGSLSPDRTSDDLLPVLEFADILNYFLIATLSAL